MAVSDYLPNLTDLIEELHGSGKGVPDARELAEAALSALDEQELDQGLEDVISAWEER